MDKKGAELLTVHIVFVVIVLVFIAAMFLFISRAGSQATLYEQAYAKKIALLIDGAKPGTTIELALFDAYQLAEKNNFEGTIVQIANDARKVTVRLYDGGGYDFYYFNDVSVVWNIDAASRLLTLEIGEVVKEVN